MRFDLKSRSGVIAAVVTVVNTIYFIGVSFLHQPTDFSNALIYAALVEVVLGVIVCANRAWSVSIVLFSFALLLFFMSIDWAT